MIDLARIAPKPLSKRPYTLAFKLAFGIFIGIHGVLAVGFLKGSIEALAMDGLGGLIVVLIWGVGFLYATTIFPLWIYLIQGLAEQAYIRSIIALILYPFLIIIILSSLISSIVPANLDYSPFWLTISTTLTCITFGLLTYVFFQDVKIAYQLRKIKKSEVIEHKQQPKEELTIATEEEIQHKKDSLKMNSKSMSPHMYLLIYAGIAYGNYIFFTLWEGLALLPLKYLAILLGSQVGYQIVFMGVAFPTLWLLLLIEIPVVAYVVKRVLYKDYPETYYNILLIFYIVALSLITSSLWINPEQISFKNTYIRQEARYDFSTVVPIRTTATAKHEVNVAGNIVLWKEHTAEYPFNVWDLFIFEFDPETGFGTTTQITDNQFASTLLSGAERGSPRIENGKIYWQQRTAKGAESAYVYDPRSGKTSKVDVLPGQTPEQRKEQLVANDERLEKYQDIPLQDWDSDGTYVVYPVKTGEYTSSLYLERLPLKE